ncbi:hypothetical protein SESBI_31271 [Sesbania bispinosa]|nr:hypothetical protein SESBI_31271 [Sesbania bispinosa]
MVLIRKGHRLSTVRTLATAYRRGMEAARVESVSVSESESVGALDARGRGKFKQNWIFN